jgi:hypothetical protein
MADAVGVAIRVRPFLPGEEQVPNEGTTADLSDPSVSKVRVRINAKKVDVRSTFSKVFPTSATQQDVFDYCETAVDGALKGINATVFAYGQTNSGKTHTMLGSLQDMGPSAATVASVAGSGDAELPSPTSSGISLASSSNNNSNSSGSSSSSSHQQQPQQQQQHTMFSDDAGLIPRAAHRVFQLAAADSELQLTVTCSFLQIYNNQVYDLLRDKSMKSPLRIRERPREGIFINGLSHVQVSSAQDILSLLHSGGARRAVRGTEYNEASSRSHAILQLSIETQRDVQDPVTSGGGAGSGGGGGDGDDDGGGGGGGSGSGSGGSGGSGSGSSSSSSTRRVIRRAKLNLVDLAGSEKWNTARKMVTAQERELTAINSSLSALGNVISALADDKRSHVPYRDSALTRILQDALGGNSRTVLIATVSPTLHCAEESISTLKFADRASHVRLKIKVNELLDDAALLARANREIQRLKRLLKKHSSQQVRACLRVCVVRACMPARLRARVCGLHVRSLCLRVGICVLAFCLQMSMPLSCSSLRPLSSRPYMLALSVAVPPSPPSLSPSLPLPLPRFSLAVAPFLHPSIFVVSLFSLYVRAASMCLSRLPPPAGEAGGGRSQALPRDERSAPRGERAATTETADHGRAVHTHSRRRSRRRRRRHERLLCPRTRSR